MGVEVGQCFDGGLTLGRPRTADQNAIRVLEIAHRGAFRQELRIRQDLKTNFRAIGREDRGDRLGSLHGNGRFFDDDLRRVGMLGDGPRDGFHKSQVGRPAGPESIGLGRRIHRHEDHVGAFDRTRNVRGIGEIAPAYLPHDLRQPRLVHGQFVRIPGRDPRRVHVDDRGPYSGATLRDDRHRSPPDIACANATDVHDNGIGVPSKLAGRLAQSKADLAPSRDPATPGTVAQPDHRRARDDS